MTTLSKSFKGLFPWSPRICRTHHRVLILLATLLFISSGSLVILHLTHTPSTSTSQLQDPYSSFSSSSSSITRWTAGGFKSRSYNHQHWDKNKVLDGYDDTEGQGNDQRQIFDQDQEDENKDFIKFIHNNPEKDPYRTTFGRPRAALPHRNTFNDERKQMLMQQQLEAQEQQLKRSHEQIPEAQQDSIPPHIASSEQGQEDQERQHQHHSSTPKEQTSTESGQESSLKELIDIPSNNINSNKGVINDRRSDSEDNNSSGSGDDEYIRQSALDPRPFEDILQQQAGANANIKAPTRYLTYLPYAGITNQFYGMLRGMEIAKALGRTLIIPPITSSSHDKSKQNQPWSKFLDLKKFSQLTGANVVEFHELRDQERTPYNQILCRITCGFGSKRSIDFTAKAFLRQWRLNATLTPLPVDDGKLETILSTLEPYDTDKHICVSNTYKVAVKDKSEWEKFGQHLHFTQELEQFVQRFLDKTLSVNRISASEVSVSTPATVSDNEDNSQGSPATTLDRHRYIAVHVRRGDFAKYCEGNFAGAKMIHCLPTTDQIAERVNQIQEQLNPTLDDPSQMLPVFVATNERDPQELRRFANLGWQFLDHETMRTIETLGVFGPMMVDQVFMAYAEALVGIQMSTFSRVGALRQRDWRGRQVEYM
ncbi:hypothetical protein BX616_003951 [Lobosporangium transversale]|uniref:GDP-fucose protein O-fucosyltransferase 2 n=1 Tax=Lobosporangium transversale TaxID=64571 RepID=A0A1Y2H0N3_9FUNG|nr:GDP-fucose protein O-fucosyltransferase-domain-containing protein [Lobosporangium transversale]KAF9916365.1 hypothetical protein BX616_003951 [Lobosporangium transversale]ORZ27604.1 GDP-fucose protein O-fucosyltransferase-domain-containing protein [Lobosporangium transversale]|eukprot:XP_021885307.1 GDP-fucose protein O-fucosyltransferase-domain-containing protein [Lobosporangium transversale]